MGGAQNSTSRLIDPETRWAPYRNHHGQQGIIDILKWKSDITCRFVLKKHYFCGRMEKEVEQTETENINQEIIPAVSWSSDERKQLGGGRGGKCRRCFRGKNNRTDEQLGVGSEGEQRIKNDSKVSTSSSQMVGEPLRQKKEWRPGRSMHWGAGIGVSQHGLVLAM